MASLDALPADQRAVLDLVLQRGRSYDDIAGLLAIDRAGVRARALAAFDQLGPETGVPPERRALITDYLLGQLPDRVAAQTRERLGESATERAWARAIASELGTVASKPLPEIPAGPAGGAAGGTAAPVDREPIRQAAGSEAVDGDPGGAAASIAPEPRPPRPRKSARQRQTERTGSFLTERPSSRLGGALILLVGVVVVVVVVVLLGGSGSKRHSSTTADTHAASGSTTSANATTGTSSSKTSTSAAKVVGQINLNPPSGTGSSKGVALVVKDGSAYGVIIRATGVAPNNHNAYAVWLDNSPTDSVRLGFVTPAVGKSRALEVGSGLPANVAHYKELLLTLESSANPKTPGPVVLQGPVTGIP